MEPREPPGASALSWHSLTFPAVHWPRQVAGNPEAVGLDSISSQDSALYEGH